MVYSLRNLVISFAIVILVVLLILFRTFSTLQSQEKEQLTIEQSRKVLQKLGPAITDMQEFESILANYSNTPEGKLLAYYDTILGKLKDDSTSMAGLAAENKEKSLSYEKLAGLIHKMIRFGVSGIQTKQSQGNERKISEETGIDIVENFKKLANQLEEENRRVLNAAYGHSISLTRDTFSFVRIISGLLLVVLIISFYFIYHDIKTRKKTGEQLKKFNEELEKQVIQKTSEIRETEKKLRRVLSSTSDNYYVIDKDCNVILINEAAERNLQKAWGKPVTTGTNILQLLPPEKDEPIRASLDKVFAGEKVEYELYISQEDLPSWVSVSYTPVSDEKGAISGAYIVAKDITERKQAEMELVEAEAKFRNLVEQSLIGVYIIQDGKFAYVNPQFAKIFGYSQTELINSFPLETVIHPNDREKVTENFRLRVEGEKGSLHYEAAGLTKDGMTVPIEVYCSGTLFEGSPAIIGTVLDISERKQAEEAIRRSEERYRSIIEQASDAIMITDQAGDFIEVNSAMCKQFGYTKEELLRLNVAQLIDPGQLETDPIHFDLLLAGKSVFRERRMMHKDRTIIEVEANVKMLPDGRLLAIARDITERKKIEKEKEHTRHLLDERIKELTTLYKSSQVFQTEYKSIEEVLQELVSILPSGWQYSDITAARISFNEMQFATPNYAPGLHKQSAEFFTPGGKSGMVEIVYLEERPVESEGPFLAEERDLINMIAEMARVYLARKHETEMKKIMEQEILNQKVQEQKRITRAILKGEETERNKIGQELHDNVNQILASIKLFLTMAKERDPKEGDELLGRSVKLIDNAIEEIRLLSQRHVTPVKKVNLEELIQSLVDRLNDTTSIQTVFSYNVNDPVVDDDLKLNIYRIVQEQINNILKHADASRVNIAVTADETSFCVEITDNGKGFDPGKARTGVGISNMINRVQSFNGELEIESSPENGTKLSIKIPC
jgi:PAS domain S-box-containing protein